MKLRPSEQLMDWLPWWVPLDDEIIKTSSGGLLRVVKLHPPDFETASPETLLNHHKRLCAALERFGNGWSFWFDGMSIYGDAYPPECDFGGNVAAQLIDANRRRYFANLKDPCFTKSTVLAMHLQPSLKEDLLAWIFGRTVSSEQGFIDFFKEHSTSLIEQVRHTMRGIETLKGDELSSYLSATVTYDPHYVRFPAGIIARGLATRHWQLGERVKIDDRHITTVEVRNLGRQACPLTVEALHELPFECRWVVTMHGLNAEQRRAEFTEILKRWMTKRKGLAGRLTEAVSSIFGKHIEAEPDPEVDTQIAALKAMQSDLANRWFALTTVNVHVWSTKSQAEADERAAEVIGKLRHVGIESRISKLNSGFALLADMPGNVGRGVSNVVRTREEGPVITSVAPVTGVHSGYREDERFGGAAWFVGKTRRGVPLFFSLNTPGGDNAHGAIVGKTGSGKSTIIGFGAAQFLRYQDASVIVFDRRRSFLPTCCCLGGDWLELGGGGVGVQPLRAIHLPEERAWAQYWILHALHLQGMDLRSEISGAVSSALRLLAKRHPDERTLTALRTYLAAHKETRDTLASYLSGGAFGDLFDGVVAAYGGSNVVGIETAGIDGLGNVAPLLMSAVMRALRRDRLEGRPNPKLLVIEEAWSWMEDPLFAAEISSMALESRKLMTVLVLATQSLTHFDNPRTKAVYDQLGNKIFMPHSEALRPDAFAVYRDRAGLLKEQIEALAGAQSKGEMLLKTEDLTRLISVQLDGEALAICGAIGPNHQARAFSLLKHGFKPGEQFTREWLRESTDDWLAANHHLELVA